MPEMSIDESEISAELETFLVSMSRFDVKKCIDNGGYAEVWTAIDRVSGDIVVLKRLTSKVNRQVLHLFIREVTTMAQADHPFFLRLIGFSFKHPLTIVSEYMPNGSLFKYRQTAKGKRNLTGTRRTLIAMGVSHAMMFLHSLSIVHRDLKSLNVLLDNDLLPRLCDFGIARFMDSATPMTKAIGTPHWMAPEMLSNGKYGPEVDVYSYAMILYELLTDEVPWGNTRPESMLRQVLVEGKRPQLPRNTPPAMKDLIKMCWAQQPKSRPSFLEIYQMFESEEVMFDNTDVKAVRSLARQLNNFQKKSPYKIIQGSPRSSRIKKSNRFRSFSSEESKPIKPKIASFDVSDQSHSEDSDFEKKRENDYSDNGYDGIQIRKINRQNKESPFIDIDAISDSRSYNFRAELKKAATSLQKVQSRQFMNAINNHFKKGKIRPAELTAILEALQKILQKKCHRDMFIELGLINTLPIRTEEVIGPCLDVLLVLFEKSPQCFEENYLENMKYIISQQPQKAIMLLALFARSFDSLTNVWELLDLLIQKSSTFFKAMVGSELISILFFLCRNFPEYRKARFSYVSNIFLKGLHFNTGGLSPNNNNGRENNTIKLAYNALSYFYKKDIEYDYGLITEHLMSEHLCKSALQLLLRIDDIPCLPEMISILLELAQKYIEATLVLLKVAALEEGAVIILRKPKWISNNLPTIIDTLRLYLAIMTHIELRPIMSRLRQNVDFFMKLCEENDSRVLTHVSMIIKYFKIDKEFIAAYSENGVFRSIFTSSLEFGDDIALHAAMIILLKVGKVGFAPEYLIFAEPLKKIIVANRKISGIAVAVIALLSQYPLCAKKFKDLGFEKLFKQLLHDSEYKEYAETFLENISVVNFY